MGRFSFLEKVLIPTYNDPAQIAAGGVEFDYEKCSGCSICVEACPADSLVFEDKKPYLKPSGANECIACGDCVAICPEEAIKVTRGYRYTKYFKTIDQGELKPPRLFDDE